MTFQKKYAEAFEKAKKAMQAVGEDKSKIIEDCAQEVCDVIRGKFDEVINHNFNIQLIKSCKVTKINECPQVYFNITKYGVSVCGINGIFEACEIQAKYTAKILDNDWEKECIDTLEAKLKELGVTLKSVGGVAYRYQATAPFTNNSNG